MSMIKGVRCPYCDALSKVELLLGARRDVGYTWTIGCEHNTERTLCGSGPISPKDKVTFTFQHTLSETRHGIEIPEVKEKRRERI